MLERIILELQIVSRFLTDTYIYTYICKCIYIRQSIHEKIWLLWWWHIQTGLLAMKNVFNIWRQYLKIQSVIFSLVSYWRWLMRHVIFYYCFVILLPSLGSLLSKTAEQNICPGLQICLLYVFSYLEKWSHLGPNTALLEDCGYDHRMHEVWFLVCIVLLCSALGYLLCPSSAWKTGGNKEEPGVELGSAILNVRKRDQVMNCACS